MSSVARLKASRSSLFSCRICSRTGGEVASPWPFAFAKSRLGVALEEALPRGARRLGGENPVGGGVVCRREVVELIATGFEMELRRSPGFEAALPERGVEFWAGMVPTDPVRRKACTVTVAEARRILVEVAGSAIVPVEVCVGIPFLLSRVESCTSILSAIVPAELRVGVLHLLSRVKSCTSILSAIVPGEIRVGVLFLLDGKLGGDAILFSKASGGMVMVSPGCTRCLTTFSEASLAHPFVASLTVDNGFLSKLCALALESCNLCSSRSALRIFSCTKSPS